jgi:hypothetical protein
MLNKDNINNTMRNFFNENPFLTRIETFPRKTVGNPIGETPSMINLPLLQTI